MWPEHKPLSRSQQLTRAEYAERARDLYQRRRAPLSVTAAYVALSIFNLLVIYEDIGPASLGARVGLLVLVDGALLGAGFLVAHELVRRRAMRLGLLCPSCGQYP